MQQQRIEVSFAFVLKKLRKEKGWSQERLASEAELDRTYISLLERGHRSPTLSTLAKIALALGTSMTDIVGRIEAQAKRNHRTAR